jgi:hypothetical protein
MRSDSAVRLTRWSEMNAATSVETVASVRMSPASLVQVRFVLGFRSPRSTIATTSFVARVLSGPYAAIAATGESVSDRRERLVTRRSYLRCHFWSDPGTQIVACPTPSVVWDGGRP